MESVPGTYMPSTYFPVVAMFVVAATAALAPLLLGYLVRPRRAYAEKLMPYESGNPPIGEPRYRFSVKFFIIAMLFVVFDVEVVFLYPWAVAFDELGLFGFLEMMLFIYFLVIGFVYAWRKGAFEWR
jgi:NADH-quinone oxidoreductase subunit A